MMEQPNQSRSGNGIEAVTPTHDQQPNHSDPTTYLYNLLKRLHGKHPVFLFGSQAAGKSLVLLSLFQYAQRGDKADFAVTLGSDILPSDAPDAESRNAAGAGFFRRSVDDVLNRVLPEATQIPIGQPVYIPINLTVPTEAYQDVPSVQLVLMDGMGEWFEKIPKSPREDHRPFPIEIEFLLRQFSGPISAIFVVPATGPNVDPADAAMHQAASAAMARYQKTREMHDDDNLLLLVTKWDAIHPPNRNNSSFGSASADDVISTLKPVGTAWQSFRTMANVPKGSRGLLQYSAAWINERHVTPPHIKAVPIFERYTRTLWNWLYGNATQDTEEGVRSRQVLFPDVEAPPAPAMSKWEWTIHRFVGTGSKKKAAR
jgi:hypothetical protein